MTLANAKPDLLMTGPLGTSTVNAASSAWHDVITVEAKITAATAYAVSIGAKYCYVPDCFLPYTASQVTFNSAVRMVAEGSDPSVFNIRAYGGDPTAITDQSAAVQAAVNGVPLTGGRVWVDSIYYLGATVTVPTDRIVVLEGYAEYGDNVGGLLSTACGFKRVSTFTTGALLSQIGPGSTIPPYGVQIRRLVFDGNNVAGDLVVITQMQNVRVEHCWFFNGNGNGFIGTGLFNSYIDYCKFFELGNTTAYPNGTSGLVLNSNANAGTVDVWITQPHFESGRGSFMTTYDPTGTHPVDGVVILGGKMEWTGNFATGFNPPAASAIGMPFFVCGNATNCLVYGLFCINGNHNAATHIRVINTSASRFYTNHTTSVGQADNQLPTWYVDFFAGSYCYVSGIFTRGAASGTAGAHIRVVESSFTGYQIDPGSQFISPASGLGVKFVNPTTGAASFFPASGGIRDKVFVVNPAIATQPMNAADGNNFEFNITTNIAVVVQAPSQAPSAGQSQVVTVTFFNGSGGALTTPPTFAAGAGAFLLTGAAVNPGNGLGVTYEFRWSPTAVGGARFRETGRTVAF